MATWPRSALEARQHSANEEGQVSDLPLFIQ